MVYSKCITAKGVVRHDAKRLFHIRSKVSQNKTEQIKCNGINKNYFCTKQCSSTETVVVAKKWLPK